MSIKNCPDCNHKISTSTAACPSCGRPNPKSIPPAAVVASIVATMFLVYVWGVREANTWADNSPAGIVHRNLCASEALTHTKDENCDN